MKKISYLIILLLLSACFRESETTKPIVAVSILPQKYLVEAIADTLVNVVVMIPPGASPATWEATPRQMTALGDASVYLMIGHISFENAWMPNIKKLNEEMKVLDLSEGINLLGIEHRNGEHSHTGIDPHIWLSPERLALMAEKTYEVLKIILPENHEALRVNYDKLIEEIVSLDNFITEELSVYKGRTFLIFHPSLAYFANDYGLIQESIEFEGKEPSPAHMKEMIVLAREKDIKIIFVQQEFDIRNAQIIAKEIKGEVVQINPLAFDWPDELRNITIKLKNAFQK
jgi:zinc transport system substrate-binding protein